MNRLQFHSWRVAELAGAMRKDACEAVPGDVDLWPQIEARLRTRRSRGHMRNLLGNFYSVASGFMPATKTQPPHHRDRNTPVMAPLFMLVLIVWGLVAFDIGRQTGARTRELPVYRHAGTQNSAFSGTALASDANGDMLLERVLDIVRLDEVHRTGLMNHVSLSQEAKGCIAQIKQTYADANRLIIAMTAQMPGTSPGQLRIHGGIVSLDGAEYNGKNPLLLYETSASNASGTTARLLVYDVSLLDPMPDELNVAVAVSAVVGSDTDPRSNRCPGPFPFNLSVPVTREGTRVLQLDRALTVAGETVTLEKIMITPSATQAIVRAGDGAEDSGKWDYMSVSVVQRNSANERNLEAATKPQATSVELFDGRRSLELVPLDLAPHAGTWTLTVNHLEKKASRNSTATIERLHGPWTFQFEVPAR